MEPAGAAVRADASVACYRGGRHRGGRRDGRFLTIANETIHGAGWIHDDVHCSSEGVHEF